MAVRDGRKAQGNVLLKIRQDRGFYDHFSRITEVSMGEMAGRCQHVHRRLLKPLVFDRTVAQSSEVSNVLSQCAAVMIAAELG